MQSVSTAMFLTNQESVVPYCRDCVFGTVLYWPTSCWAHSAKNRVNRVYSQI